MCQASEGPAGWGAGLEQVIPVGGRAACTGPSPGGRGSLRALARSGPIRAGFTATVRRTGWGARIDHNNKSKQAKKTFAAPNSVVWKSHFAVIRPLPEEASTEGVTGYID